MGLLDELFYGNINPLDKMKVADEEYGNISEKIADEKDNWLYPLLTEENFMRYDELESLDNKTVEYEVKQSFKEGFKLGVMLMIEVLSGE